MQNENILGVIQPGSTLLQILAASILKGASVSPSVGLTYVDHDNIRPATLTDFNEFRVSPDGYIADPEYDFIWGLKSKLTLIAGDQIEDIYQGHYYIRDLYKDDEGKRYSVRTTWLIDPREFPTLDEALAESVKSREAMKRTLKRVFGKDYENILGEYMKRYT